MGSVNVPPYEILDLRLSFSEASADDRLKLFIQEEVSEKSFVMDAHPEETIYEIKSKIWEMEGIPTNMQIISFGGNRLEDDRTVKDCGIQHESTLTLYFGVRRRWRPK